MNLSRVVESSVTPTVTVGAYSANDVIGGLLRFDVQSAGGFGVVNNAIVTDDANVISALTLYLFNAAPDAIADNGAFAPGYADLQKLVGIIPFNTYSTLNSNKWTQGTLAPNQSVALPQNALWGYLVTAGTPTLTALCITVRLSVLVEG